MLKTASRTSSSGRERARSSRRRFLKGHTHTVAEKADAGRPGRFWSHWSAIVDRTVEQMKLTTGYTRRAVGRIREESRKPGEPFFLYLAYNMPHLPLAAPERFRGETGGLAATQDILVSVVEAVAGPERPDSSARTR
jgi:hypothetical protein